MKNLKTKSELVAFYKKLKANGFYDLQNLENKTILINQELQIKEFNGLISGYMFLLEKCGVSALSLISRLVLNDVNISKIENFINLAKHYGVYVLELDDLENEGGC